MAALIGRLVRARAATAGWTSPRCRVDYYVELLRGKGPADDDDPRRASDAARRDGRRRPCVLRGRPHPHALLATSGRLLGTLVRADLAILGDDALPALSRSHLHGRSVALHDPAKDVRWADRRRPAGACSWSTTPVCWPGCSASS